MSVSKTLDDLWCEKYRPQKLEDLCLHPKLRERIESWGKESIPHLLLVGAAGIGKTTLARILVQDILDCDYLYINASDENGVETMRSKVSGFVQTKSLNGHIKVVILDEADSISPEGQNILRNMMESYADTARFILTGNYAHKIRTPIQSRCQRLDITFSIKDAVIRCFTILQKEGISFNQEEKGKLFEIIKRYFPNLRTVIQSLQECWVNNQWAFNESVDNSQLAAQIYHGIVYKKSLETRKFLIENEQLFNSDWDQLLKDLLNYIYEVKELDEYLKKNMIITIADHLEKATRVMDKEINFIACVFTLENME